MILLVMVSENKLAKRVFNKIENLCYLSAKEGDSPL